MDNYSPEASEKTFPEAVRIAESFGMVFLNPSDGCYQLRFPSMLWIVNFYPRRNGMNPRAYHDPNRRGPFVHGLPERWSLAEAAQAFCEEWSAAAKGDNF